MQTATGAREGSVVQGVDAIWFAIVHVVGARRDLLEADTRLVISAARMDRALRGGTRIFVPRIQKLSTQASEARS